MPLNVAFFGSGALAGISKVRVSSRDCVGLGGALNAVIGVSKRQLGRFARMHAVKDRNGGVGAPARSPHTWEGGQEWVLPQRATRNLEPLLIRSVPGTWVGGASGEGPGTQREEAK